MKNITLFTFLLTILFSVQIFAEEEPVPPIEDQGGQQKKCQQHQQDIVSLCSGNPALLQAQQKSGQTAALNNGGSTEAMARTTLIQQGEVSTSKTAVDTAKKQCTQAASDCYDQCQKEMQEHQQRAQANPTIAQKEYRERDIDQSHRTFCENEGKKAIAAMEKASMDLGQLLQAIASLLQSLGIGDDQKPEEIAGPPDEEGDPCEGENAALLIECAGESDPIGTRASVSGSTGVGDLSGGNGQGLMGQVPEGDPGGDEAAGNSPSNFPGGQFGAAGSLGAFGDSPGSSVGAASDGSNKLDTDIHKGYMSGGDGGFGSFSSGGGGGARSSGSSINPFSRTATSDGRKKLQSALDKVAAAGRGPASSDGTNGPFQNIWGVVTQTYKKTSPSMFHKE